MASIDDGELHVEARLVVENDVFTIREVYFRCDGSIENWTLKPCFLEGESVADLSEYLEWLGGALTKSVLKLTKDGNMVEWIKSECRPTDV